MLIESGKPLFAYQDYHMLLLTLCRCTNGWSGPSCAEDVQECQTGNGGCSPLRECVESPTAGVAPSCKDCTGFYKNDGARDCKVEAECTLASERCDEAALCARATTGASKGTHQSRMLNTRGVSSFNAFKYK